MCCVTIKYEIDLVCEQSLLYCDTVSVEQKGQDTLRNASKIYNDDVAGITMFSASKEKDRDMSHATQDTSIKGI